MGSAHFLMKYLEHVGTEMSLHVLAYNLWRVMKIMGIIDLDDTRSAGHNNLKQSEKHCSLNWVGCGAIRPCSPLKISRPVRWTYLAMCCGKKLQVKGSPLAKSYLNICGERQDSDLQRKLSGIDGNNAVDKNGLLE